MLLELSSAFTIFFIGKYLFSDERELRLKWDDALMNCKVNGIRNKDNQTFYISKAYKKEFGYLCIVNIPKGLSVESLQSAKGMLQDNLNCIIEIEKERFKDYITVKVINKIIDFTYEPVKTKPNEIYLGNKLDSSKYVLDLNKDPHILVAGKTGTGKSFLFASILTNLIYNSSKDIEVYLLQVMKGEIDIFKNCPGVKFTSDNSDEIFFIIEKLVTIIHKRSKLFTNMGVKNITQWNKLFPSKKMKRIIVGIEEISFFMNVESPCFQYLNSITKAGRASGVHLIALTQRTTIVNLPSELKAQMSVITAKQRSTLDSRNAIDIDDAAYLGEQEFIASTNDGYVYFKAPKIDEDFKILNSYVPQIKIPCSKPKIEEKNVKNNDKLSYEETQKLKVFSQCYVIKDKPMHNKSSEQPPNSSAPRKRKGAVKKELNEDNQNERNR